LCSSSPRRQRKTIRTLVIPILLLSLVAACAAPLAPTATSTPQPTATPVEIIASKVEDLVGVWKSRFGGEVAYMQYRADGTFKLARTVADLESNPIVSGTFWFEGTVFNTFDDLCDEGTYEVRVQKQGDKPIRLVFKEIKDPCRERSMDLKWKMLWVEP
jgi:hypothetical protein